MMAGSICIYIYILVLNMSMFKPSLSDYSQHDYFSFLTNTFEFRPL